MVLVPAGEFGFGGDKQRIALPAFYVDQTEVPNAEYAKFCQATNRALPDRFPADKPDYPLVNVTIGDARAFAEWAGKRLPNAFEWEKAARGVDGRTFPWGNEHDPARANVGTHQLRPVDDFAGGASPFGALQMVGNVWEFVDQLRAPSRGSLEELSEIEASAARRRALVHDPRTILRRAAARCGDLGIRPGTGAVERRLYRIPLREERAVAVSMAGGGGDLKARPTGAQASGRGVIYNNFETPGVKNTG